MSRKGFSLIANEGIYFNSEEDKIGLVHCPNGNNECLTPLPVINQYFRQSHQGRIDKDYNKAIEALENAYAMACAMDQAACVECAVVVRSTIVDSMQLIHSELKDMTGGWFASKRFRPAFEKATLALGKMRE